MSAVRVSWNEKKGCAKFLGNLKTLIFAFFMTDVVNRPPANANNHPN